MRKSLKDSCRQVSGDVCILYGSVCILYMLYVSLDLDNLHLVFASYLISLLIFNRCNILYLSFYY